MTILISTFSRLPVINSFFICLNSSDGEKMVNYHAWAKMLPLPSFLPCHASEGLDKMHLVVLMFGCLILAQLFIGPHML